jgi:hypothetical protein
MAPDILQYKEELVQRVKENLDRNVCCRSWRDPQMFAAAVANKTAQQQSDVPCHVMSSRPLTAPSPHVVFICVHPELRCCCAGLRTAAPVACVQEAELLNMESAKDYDLVSTGGLLGALLWRQTLVPCISRARIDCTWQHTGQDSVYSKQGCEQERGWV